MTFQPLVPFSGAAGYAFLERTRDRQLETFQQSAAVQRNVDAFRDRIAGITSAEALVKDFQLLKVALGAFGLDEDINNKFLIQKVLSSNTADPEALTSRFADKRYETMAKAFGFGDALGPRVGRPGFADRIVEAYTTRQFEIAVGEQDQTMRLALGLERELGQIIDKGASPDATWFNVMANKPLRQVFETALGLPQSFGALDLDRQLEGFRAKAQSAFGVSEIADFADPERQEELRRLFLVRAQVANGLSGPATPASTALTLLTNGSQGF